MRILHTSDWHLGHRLYEAIQLEEQSLFLDYLLGIVEQEKVDVLVVSGDVFDQALPSSSAQQLYYDFLIRLSQTRCRYAVITGGNHDAPGTINAPKTLLKSLSVYVVGKVGQTPQEQVLEFELEDEHLLIAAVPYLRDKDIRRAVAGETFEQLAERYTKALINYYQSVAEVCRDLKRDDSFLLAMGHLFAVGGTLGDSEQSIYVGGLGDIAVEDMPDIFQYWALGHLHRPQKVAKQEHIRYSGSPIPLSFGELNYEKSILLIETQKDALLSVREIKIPHFRTMYQIVGDLESCKEQLQQLTAPESVLKTWVEILVEADKGLDRISFDDFRRGLDEWIPEGVEVLSIRLKKEFYQKGAEEVLYKPIKEYNPLDVFKMKCKEMEVDLEQEKDLLDAFSELLSEIKEN